MNRAARQAQNAPKAQQKRAPAASPLSEAEMERLDALLEQVPAPLEALDIVALDGFLCGVLLQPDPPPPERWLHRVSDLEGRALPTAFPAAELHALVRRRHAELSAAIVARRWFDPWVFELDEADSPSDAVLPWVAGFAAAMDLFPALMRLDNPALLEPLALLYAHFDPEDLEDADDLLAVIETLEPPSTLAEGVEDLVRAVLLIADVSRPKRQGKAAP